VGDEGQFRIAEGGDCVEVEVRIWEHGVIVTGRGVDTWWVTQAAARRLLRRHLRWLCRPARAITLHRLGRAPSPS
jgi:hypothetical protein